MYIRQAPKVCRFDFPGRGVVPRKATDLCVCVCVCVCLINKYILRWGFLKKRTVYAHKHTTSRDGGIISYSLLPKSQELWEFSVLNEVMHEPLLSDLDSCVHLQSRAEYLHRALRLFTKKQWTNTEAVCAGVWESQHVYVFRCLIKHQEIRPWLVWLSALESCPVTKRLRIWFLVRAHAWVAGLIPSQGT